MRLRQRSTFVVHGTLEFQFHKGAIKTIKEEWKQAYYRSFNSIKVRLRHTTLSNLSFEITSFNSIKVRLRPGISTAAMNGYSFQFHKGAIKTGLLKSVVVFGLCFNSIKVRLRHSDNTCYRLA